MKPNIGFRIELMKFGAQMAVGMTILIFCIAALSGDFIPNDERAWVQSLLTFIIGWFAPSPKLKKKNIDGSKNEIELMELGMAREREKIELQSIKEELDRRDNIISSKPERKHNLPN